MSEEAASYGPERPAQQLANELREYKTFVPASLANSAAVELERLDALINTAAVENFLESVRLEAAHQVERWGETKDRSKYEQEWYWLVGYLAGKCLRAHTDGDQVKALHHTISTAAVCFQWHKAIQGEPTLSIRSDLEKEIERNFSGEVVERLPDIVSEGQVVGLRQDKT
ncbi:MAG: hypothetical protein OXC08_20675 [Thiotrichales bacterium]|nr:hypothetical protein [Thiotrichales bacterium]